MLFRSLIGSKGRNYLCFVQRYCKSAVKIKSNAMPHRLPIQNKGNFFPSIQSAKFLLLDMEEPCMLVSTWDHRLRRNSALRLTVILSLAGSHTLPSISGRDGEIHQALLHFREGRAPLSRAANSANSANCLITAYSPLLTLVPPGDA